MLFENFAKNVSQGNRQKKYDFFIKEFTPAADTKILDVGFQDNDWYGGINSLEKNYPYHENITALGIEDGKMFSQRYPLVKVVTYDGNIFPFKDKEFSIVWSNAVIEHVGGYEKQKLFLSELIRTGKSVFMTTPNRYFPIEVHTRLPLLHFLPKVNFDKILIFLNKKWATGNYMNLLSENDIKKMMKELGVLNYSIKKNKFLFFTLDFVVVIR